MSELAYDDRFREQKANAAGRWIDRVGKRRIARWAVAMWSPILDPKGGCTNRYVLRHVLLWATSPSGAIRRYRSMVEWDMNHLRKHPLKNVPPGSRVLIVERPFYSRMKLLPIEVHEDET